ncbi:FecR domain-containing protein [Labilibaculum sp. K2S]|uniref:FecR family protein n=1 Tax=Labilibaculum sp. K2S TaxID=3056386 RepID=UPI0025A472DF|nr:FecR family protein [Labilibaculum sp. K2S]MDM8158339.1 FecR domain-containing protein [Labilibaculum sp. K2S]
MKNNNLHISDTFLAKFLLGETNKEEQSMVIGWLEEKHENRKHLDQLERVWLESGKLNPHPISVNKKIAWTKLSFRLDQYEKTLSPSIQRFSRFRIALISSAAAFILVLFGIFNWYSDDYTQTEEFLLTNTSQSTLQNSLPDGSEIYLNRLSQISYHTSKAGLRIAELKGEAFFHVKRDTLRPFIIHAGIGGVKVLGTSFTMKIKENGDIAVDVNSGKVELFRPNKARTDTLHLILTNNEGGLISNQQDTIIRLANNSSAFFWVDKRLSFRNKPLKEVFKVLESCYHITINSDNPKINNLYYSSSFIDEDPENVIKVISKTFNLTYSRKENTFIISDLKKNE